MKKPSVVVLDDRRAMVEMLKSLLEVDYDVFGTVDPREAVERISHAGADVVVSDMRMPGMDGMQVLREVKRASPATEVILMTAYGNVKEAVEAMRLGGYDYISKPFEPEEMALLVARAVERKRLLERTKYLEDEVGQRFAFGSIVGTSPGMSRVFSLLRKVVDTDATVLVVGESGTGKEIVARALHYEGRRRAGKFVVVHCAGVPRDLAESEIFGHAKGAFSGAIAAKRGLAEEADGGTLFLDDVDQLTLDVQAKMNRLIQEKEVRSVGENDWRKVNVRIVAATNQDLMALVGQGKFREDLYYRLNVFQVVLPPLRERREDIAPLATMLLARHAERMGKPAPAIAPEAMQAIERHPWPGNVRELENALERAILLAEGKTIRLEHLPPPPAAERSEEAAAVSIDLPYAEAMENATAVVAREYLLGVLKRFGGNVTRAAEHAGVERQSLHRLMKRYGVRSQDAEADEAHP